MSLYNWYNFSLSPGFVFWFFCPGRLLRRGFRIGSSCIVRWRNWNLVCWQETEFVSLRWNPWIALFWSSGPVWRPRFEIDFGSLQWIGWTSASLQSWSFRLGIRTCLHWIDTFLCFTTWTFDCIIWCLNCFRPRSPAYLSAWIHICFWASLSAATRLNTASSSQDDVCWNLLFCWKDYWEMKCWWETPNQGKAERFAWTCSPSELRHLSKYCIPFGISHCGLPNCWFSSQSCRI